MDCKIIKELINYCQTATPVQVYELLTPLIPFLERIDEIRRALEIMEVERGVLTELDILMLILEERLEYMDSHDERYYLEMLEVYKKYFPERYLLMGIEKKKKSFTANLTFFNTHYLTYKLFKDILEESTQHDGEKIKPWLPKTILQTVTNLVTAKA